MRNLDPNSELRRLVLLYFKEQGGVIGYKIGIGLISRRRIDRIPSYRENGWRRAKFKRIQKSVVMNSPRGAKKNSGR